MKRKDWYSKPEIYIWAMEDDLIKTSSSMLKDANEYNVDNSTSDGSWGSLPRK